MNKHRKAGFRVLLSPPKIKAEVFPLPLFLRKTSKTKDLYNAKKQNLTNFPTNDILIKITAI